MELTGERYLPERGSAEISYEHWHRYLLAAELSRGRTVLDIACGEGYGSDLLATAAESVVGVDREFAVILHASAKYRRPGLRFCCGSVDAIPIGPEQLFDLVVSFETIEHVDAREQGRFLHEAKRLLKPGGALLISTPNKTVYSDRTGYSNEFHRKEFYQDEFTHFLGTNFASVILFGQSVYPASFLWQLGKAAGPTAEYQLTPAGAGFRPAPRDLKEARYLIAWCSDAAIPEHHGSVLLDASSRLIESLREELERRGQALEALDARLAERPPLEDVRIILDELRREGAAMRDALDELRREGTEAREALGELRHRTEATREGLDELRHQTEAMREGLDELQREETEIRDALSGLATEVRRTEEQLHLTIGELQRETLGLRGSLDEFRQQALRAYEQFATTAAVEDEFDRLHGALAALRGLVERAGSREVKGSPAGAAAPHATPRLSYPEIVVRLRNLVASVVPPDANVLVVSKGDDALLSVGGRARHFPQDRYGGYAGFHPRDSAAAIEHLESLRKGGADYLVFPATAFWWLQHYADFSSHLERHYRLVARQEETGAIFVLRREGEVAARAEPPQYAHLKRQLRSVVEALLPPESALAVISHGDPDLASFNGINCTHFPGTEDGEYAGYHPADSRAAIQELERARDAGWEFLLIPTPSAWWLDYYTDFNDYLQERCRLLMRQEYLGDLYSIAPAADEYA